MTTTIRRRITPAMHAVYLLLIAAAVIAAGTLLGYLGGANAGYSGLVRPKYMPPDITFSIVWPVLYFCMAASLYLTLIARPIGGDERAAWTASIVLFFVQLALNFCWPFLFFRARAYYAAFVWLCVLCAVVTALIIVDLRVDKWAAAIMVPYLAWLIFAAVLNIMIAAYN